MAPETSTDTPFAPPPRSAPLIFYMEAKPEEGALDELRQALCNAGLPEPDTFTFDAPENPGLLEILYDGPLTRDQAFAFERVVWNMPRLHLLLPDDA